MFRIKICGITNRDDALAAFEAGADAVGLNFYANSPRAVTRTQAEEILSALPNDVVKVAVTVNMPTEDVRRLWSELGFHFVQLHGDEPPETLSELAGAAVIRAMRLGPGDAAAGRAYVARCRQLGTPPALLLLDANSPSDYGGTGAAGDWVVAAELSHDATLPPVVLAGGLRPGNVAEAVAAVRPAAVDVASGVESSPGRKDRNKLTEFVAAASKALREIGST